MNVTLLDRIKTIITGKRKIVRNKDTGTPLQRYYKSFFHALDGMSYTLFCEHNMVIILVAAILTIILGFLCQINTAEWLFCLLVIGSISAAEFINTAIEAVVDLVSPDFNKLAKIAKDTASSATLILCMTALIGGILIFIPKILALF